MGKKNYVAERGEGNYVGRNLNSDDAGNGKRPRCECCDCEENRGAVRITGGRPGPGSPEATRPRRENWKKRSTEASVRGTRGGHNSGIHNVRIPETKDCPKRQNTAPSGTGRRQSG